MQTDNDTHAPYDAPDLPDVCVASGWGVKVWIQYGQLVVEDGISRRRRSRRFSRATVPFTRLVVLAASGYVSFDAVRWCRDTGVVVYQIDREGQVLSISGSLGVDRPDLRRAQAFAASNETGLRITRWLIDAKMRGQAQMARQLPVPVQLRVPDLNAREPAAPGDLRPLEAELAVAYWRAWESVEVRFAKADLPRIPEHWRAFGKRASPVSGHPRLAANPPNALLNFTYAVLEAEARLACLAVGLDPGVGVLHADQPSRDSLALDVMEPVRPAVDAYLLDLLQGHVFRAKDFLETRRGVCRVNPPLTHHLAATGPLWASHLGPVVEQVAKMLLPGKRLPTPLTQDNRSAGRDRVRVNPKRPRTVTSPRPPRRCRTCGEEVPGARSYCDTCLPEHEAEHLADLQQQGLSVVARLRAEGRDPTHGGEAARKRGATQARRHAARREWDRQHSQRPNPEIFTREILPGLQGLPQSRLMEATGLSRRYCGWIQRGVYIPHPIHWEALRALLTGGTEAIATMPR